MKKNLAILAIALTITGGSLEATTPPWAPRQMPGGGQVQRYEPKSRISSEPYSLLRSITAKAMAPAIVLVLFWFIRKYILLK